MKTKEAALNGGSYISINQSINADFYSG